MSGSVTADWTEIDAVVTVEKDRRDAGMPHQSKRLEQQQEETYESAPGRDGRCSMCFMPCFALGRHTCLVDALASGC